jgi:hypothetical protein
LAYGHVEKFLHKKAYICTSNPPSCATPVPKPLIDIETTCVNFAANLGDAR